MNAKGRGPDRWFGLALFLCAAPALRAQDPAATEALEIVCFGDSTTAPRDTIDQVYAVRLAALLQSQGVDCVVHNAGVGGSHTGRLEDNARHRRAHALDRLEQAVRARAADVVVVQFGINDCWVDTGGEGAASRIPLADYEANLRRIASTLKQDGARVLLMTPNRLRSGVDAWRAARLADYAETVRRLAAELELELVDVWRRFGESETAGQDLDRLLLDDVHPNDRGHALVAEAVALLLLADEPGPPIPIVQARRTAVAGVERSPDCYHQFREGGVVVTKSGRVVLVAQGREKSGWSDRSGQDLVCRFSDDHGRSWSPARLVAEFGDGSICPNATVYDALTDTVHVLFNVFEWDFRDADSRKPMEGRECRQYQVSSADGGESWSAPRELTGMLGSDRHVTVFGSGEGIQLRHGEHAGRLVVPGGFQDRWGNRMFYSDDHGQSWQVGPVAPRTAVADRNVRLENKVAELSDGTLVLNARCTPHRVRAFSEDGGVHWTPQQVDPGLPAISCNGSLLALRHPFGDADVLLCAVPVGPKRTHGSIYLSLDGGRTWPRCKLVVPGLFAYSSLIELHDETVGLVYEARDHRDLELVKLDLRWLLAD